MQIHDQLARLAEYGYQIAREHQVDKLIPLLANQIRELLDADRCSVFILDVEKNELWSQVAQGLEGKILRFPATKGVIGQVVRTGDIVNEADAYQNTFFNPEGDMATGYKTKTMLCMPIKNSKNVVLGVFQVLNKKSGLFTAEDEGLLHLLSSIAAAALENMQLSEELRSSQFEAITRLMTLVQLRDETDLAGHLTRMSEYARLIAEALGWSEQDVQNIYFASPLHDIGKVGIPDNILLAGRQLTDKEYEEMKKHTVYGYKVLEGVQSKLLKIARNVAVAHHERYDGKGYPYGLSGADIPIEARVAAVADVFDALMSKRVYKQSWGWEKVLNYMQEEKGKHFDPDVVDAFIKCVPKIQALMDKTK